MAVAGRGGVPATGAAAVVLTVTATEPEAAGYLTVWPEGPVPLASNLNLGGADDTVAAQAVVPLGPDGAVRVYTYAATHVVADVTGWFTADGAPAARDGLFVPVAPHRVLDTRTALRPAGGDTVVLPLPEAVAAGATAVVLNVTATETAEAGFVTVWPDGPLPLASNLNVTGAGQTVANHVVTPLGADGAVRLFTYRGAHLVADLTGWYGAPPPASG